MKKNESFSKVVLFLIFVVALFAIESVLGQSCEYCEYTSQCGANKACDTSTSTCLLAENQSCLSDTICANDLYCDLTYLKCTCGVRKTIEKIKFFFI